MSVLKRLALSSACGVLLTALLAGLAFQAETRLAFEVLLWQAVLFARLTDALLGPGPVIGHDAQGSPIHEGTPVHLLVFFFGVLLGVPIYAALSYAVLSWRERRASREPR